MGLIQRLQNALKTTILTGAIASSALISTACKQEEKENPYKGKSLDECIQIADSPKKAQDILNWMMHYDDQRNNTRDILARPPNGAFEYSGQKAFTTGSGICGDYTSLAITLLKDDVGKTIDEIYFARFGFNGNVAPHSVALYKQNGKYGKLGQEFDLEPAKFDTIWQAGEDAAQFFNTTLQSYSIFDTSFIDWKNGTNDGLVCYEPFLTSQKSAQIEITATITPTATGFTMDKTQNGPSTYVANTQTEYDSMLNKIHETFTGWPVGAANPETRDYSVLTFTPAGYPETTKTITNTQLGQGIDITTYTYDSSNRTTSQKMDFELNGAPFKANHRTMQYHGNNILNSRITKESLDGTYPPWDKQWMTVYNSDGTLQGDYQDHDGDGAWVPVIKP